MTCYTRSGDSGNTCMIGAGRLDKDDERLEAIGTFDELNSFLGAVVSFSESSEVRKIAEKVQNDLFTVCSELATLSEGIKTPKVSDSHVTEVEKAIESIDKLLPPQDKFILPGGTKTSALLQVSRAVARRAERSLVKLSKTAEINPEMLKYANRLSSLLYVLARFENSVNNVREKNPVYLQ